ncbi:MAG: sulfotransferase [Proteobacteria bacterium]|nr:sulfotransferase [Pseudomonadota bacterium]
MERDREADLATLHAVHAAATGNEFAKAAALARPALESGLEHPLLYNVLALRLEQEARLPEAVALLRRGAERFPSDVGIRNALGLCLLRLERPGEALAQFDALLAVSPDLAFAHTNRGAALLGTGALAKAEQSYRRALELDPKQVVAMTGIANIAVRRGVYDLGRIWAEQALAVAPDFPDAIVSLAGARLGEGAAADAVAHLERLLADSRLIGAERAHANGLRGDALDALGRTEEAFAAYTLCNEELRRQYAPRYAGGQTALGYVRALGSYFETAQAGDWRLPPAPGGAAAPARGHVFVLGFPRSGTTLLEVALEGQPQMVSAGENELLIDGIHEFMGDPAGLDRLSRAGASDLERLRAAYWGRAADAGADPAGRVFIDKHPLNTLKLPLIVRLFPGAKILFAYRDPRDVVLSCFRRRFQMSAPMYELLTLEGAARFYDATMTLADRLVPYLPSAPRHVRYETLVADFDAEMQGLCRFLDIEWTTQMRDFGARTRARTHATPSTAQLARGLDAGGIGAWRRYAEPMAPVLPLLEPWVTRYGYGP